MVLYRYLFVIILCISYIFCQNLSADESKLSPESVEGATTVDVKTAKKLFDKKIMFIDTRKESDWKAGRIPGAIHLDVKKDFTKENLAKILDYSGHVVIYCNGSKCHRSAKASALAIKWGYNNIYYFRGGFPAWYNDSNPIE